MEIQDLYTRFLAHPVVTTDSRDVPTGSLFFALRGETFDGNQYAAASLEKGAAYAVVDDPSVATSDRMILVENVLHTLQQLASYHRQQLSTTIIGITGTNGKTTTKELIAAVLRQKYNVLYTQGNFNNHIGVPKTLLQLTADHEMAVIEMGANHPGEIKTLVEIVQPDYGIITNVGKAHLLGFGSFEGVIKTKGELYDYLRDNAGTVFINNDNPHLAAISHDLQLVKYGHWPADDLLVQGELLECNPFVHFRWNGHDVQTHLIGSYNLDNLLAAACIGTFFTVPASDICTALGQYTPSNNRSQLTVTASNRLVVDAYNANPTSMAAALDNFQHIQASHKMAILGDMKELGSVSLDEHRRILSTLLHSDFEQVWLVGEEFQKAVNATDSQPSANAPTLRLFADVEAVKTYLQTDKPQGFTILVKGSNSTKLVQLVDHL
ncbi:MAG: UDP-N-acetylmuramoyl-tripeptide--D-alanyl-D-alanine ligase [Bacteroidaceae bacterium]|nr:UDP-N-acetylmuramoyl-tripeptide--D-alanyl-D-alanine ligase [Bacteroidaceae bacterium]